MTMKRIHCVGILFPSSGSSSNVDPNAYLLVQVRVTKPSRMRILRVLMDDTSVNMCSPFYEHDVLLEADGRTTDIATTSYTVKKWYAARLRIAMSEEKTEGAVAAGIKTVMRQSFFPLMAAPDSVQPWQRHFFHWELHHKGLAHCYVAQFALHKWLAMAQEPPPVGDEEESTVEPDFDDDGGGGGGDDEERDRADRVTLVRRKVAATMSAAHHHQQQHHTEYTVKDYWAKFGACYKQELDQFIKTLGIKTANVVVNDANYLFGVLDNYRTLYITNYMKCRFLEMPIMQVLKRDGDARFDGVRTAALSAGVVRDLLLFYNEVESVAAGEQPATTATTYFNFGSLMDVLIGAGKLLPTLAFLADDDARDTGDDSCDTVVADGLNEKQMHTRHELLRRIWVRKTMLDLQRRARDSFSTVLPIDVGTVIYYYNRMFGLRGDVKDRLIYLDGSSDVDTEVNETRPARITDYSNKHYVEALRVFVGALSGDGVKEAAAAPLRIVCDFNKQKLTTYTPLFLIECKAQTNATEEQLRVLYCEKMNKHVSVVNGAATWSAAEWQQSVMALDIDHIENQLYQTRFVLINVSPCESRQALDMALVRDLMAANVYEVTLVRPNGSDYSLMRASLFFDREEDEGESGLTLEHFHDRFMDLKALLQCGDMRGKKALLLVMDAHLFSIGEMQALLRWIHVKRLIRHVVMMGSADALPLHAEGQAFCDLMNWADYTVLNNACSMFDKEAFHQELVKLVQHAMQPDVNFFMCQRYGLLAQCLKTKLTTGQTRRRRINFYHFVSAKLGGAGGNQLASDDHVVALEEQIDHASFHGITNIVVKPLTLAQLPFLHLTRESVFEHEWVFFVVTLAQLKRMDRNQLNHLFMEVPNLCVVLSSPLSGGSSSSSSRDVVYNPQKTSALKLLRKSLPMQLYPNQRYTWPYVKHWEQKRREGAALLRDDEQ